MSRWRWPPTTSAVPVSDCLGVVRLCNAPIVKQLKPTFKYAGVRKFALARDNACNLMEAQHIPAHRSDATIQDLPFPERILANANKAVDLGAKAAREGAHPATAPGSQSEIDMDVWRSKQVCFVAAATLPLFPRMNHRRLPRIRHAPTRQIRQGWHHWESFEGGWRCGHCLVAASPGTRESQLPVNGCTGRPQALRRLLDSGDLMGHRLQRCETSDGAPLYFCVNCGAWALKKCQKLLTQCRPQDCKRGTAGFDALRRIEKHQHPDYHRHRGERITTAMRHDALELRDPPSSSTYRSIREHPQPLK